MNLQLRSANLFTYEYLDISSKGTGDTYANIKIETINDNYSGHILRYVPRGMQVVSDVESVEVSAINNLAQTELNTFYGSVLMGIQYDEALVEAGNVSDLTLYYFDEDKSEWTALTDSWSDEATQFIYASITEPGYYVVLGKR